LLTLQKEHLHIHMTFKGVDPASGAELVKIKSGFSFGTKLTACVFVTLFSRFLRFTYFEQNISQSTNRRC
jgi:hypothetical protein